MNIETEDVRFSRYCGWMKGFWFASSDESEQWAEKKVKEGVLKPLSAIIPDCVSTQFWYVPARVLCTKDLLEYFTCLALNHFGIFEHNLEYSI